MITDRFLRAGLAATVSALLLTTAVAPSQAASANNVDDVGATERINYSGKLRMLSQRLAATACNYNAGVLPEASHKLLQGAELEFQKIVNALEFGDPELNVLGEESRRKTLAAISALRTVWDGMHPSVTAILSNGPDATATATIAELNMPLLGKAKALVVELVGEYSDPSAMTQAGAMQLDISGRQRMLTQKMSKEACAIWSGTGDDATRKALSGTMQMFELSLMALRDGLPSAGINPAPTPEIKAGLDDIASDWAVLKPILEAATRGEMVAMSVREDAYQRLNVAMAEMNAVVGLYTLSSKAGL